MQERCTINTTGDNYQLLRDKTPEIEAMQIYDTNARQGMSLQPLQK
jgi:hypothetical protein